MKRLSPHQKLRLVRLARRSARRKFAERAKRRVRNFLGGEPLAEGQGRWIKAYRDGVHGHARLLGESRPAPEVLSLIENYEPTVTFLHELREGIASHFRPTLGRRRRSRVGAPPVYRTMWDFTTIKVISAPVALMVASEYDRLRKRGGWRPSAIDYEDWNPRVRAMLDDIGFLSLCGVTEPAEPILEGAGWRLLRLESGTDADGERVGDLLQRLGLDMMLDDPSLYEAIVEALANTRHHAYPAGRTFSEPHYPGWWMTGFLDEKEKFMTIAVYDHGATIPVTLADPANSWEHYPRWRRLMMRATGDVPTIEDTIADGEAIAAAMKVGRSSTGFGFRGRGLKTFEQVLEMCPEGRLTIRSRCGEYIKEKGSKARYRSHSTPIDGTLITWHVSR